jgi:hypothetical protein
VWTRLNSLALARVEKHTVQADDFPHVGQLT